METGPPREAVSDSVKRHLSRRHLSVLNFKFNSIFNGGCTREEQIALSLKRHLFPHGGRKPEAFWIYFSTLPPISNIFLFFFREKKSIHHHRGTPLFSVCRPTPRSQSKKRDGVYHFPGKTREKGIHHRS